MVATVCASLSLSGGASAGGTVKLCMEDRDIRPWITRDGGGLNVVLLDRVASALGLRFEYQRLPWKRCLDKLKANQVDGAFGASFKPERLEVGAYPMLPGGSSGAEGERGRDRAAQGGDRGEPCELHGCSLVGRLGGRAAAW